MRVRCPVLGVVVVVSLLAGVAIGAPRPVWRPGPPNGLTGRWYPAMAYDESRQRTVLVGGFDGNSSAETWEHDGAGWQRGAVAPPGLAGRRGHVLAYDAGRGVVVLFGGTNDASHLDDTWELAGSSWSRGPAAPASLGGRAYVAGAFHPGARQVLIFGGQTIGGSTKGDSWLYDGVSWVPGPATPVGMEARYAHAMATDPRRDVVVMFGGNGPVSGDLDDTWEFDGASWAAGPSAPAGLEARYGHAMAYDPRRHAMVMVGGARCCITLMSDTWLYDGSSWTASSSGPDLTVRSGHAMAFDGAQRELLLFGGRGNDLFTPYLPETWTLQSGGWVETATPAGVPPRWMHSMVYDRARQVTVLYGGYWVWGDVWEFDGRGWTRGPDPPPVVDWRYGVGMAYDPGLAKTVIFGGSNDSCCIYFNDTWLYDGTWSSGPVAPAGLDPREGAPLVYDESRDVLVLFGGWDDRGQARNDTWELVGSNWVRGPAAPPGLTKRTYPSMAYDVARQRTVLFGGQGTLWYPDKNDTWYYDGWGWTPGPSAPDRLTPRWSAMAYDSRRGRTVLFGGTLLTADTWELGAAGRWMRARPTDVAISPRIAPAMPYDPDRAMMVLFGGSDSGGQRADTWIRRVVD